MPSDNLKINSLSIFRYSYYMAELHGESAVKTDERETTFRKDLIEVCNQTNPKKFSKKDIPSVGKLRERGSDKLIYKSDENGSNWIKINDQISRKLISRSLLDIFYIQTCVGLNEAIDLDQVQDKIHNLKTHRIDNVRGDFEPCYCIWLELPDDVLSNADLDEIYRKCLKAWTGNETLYDPIKLEYAGLAIAVSSPLWVIVTSSDSGKSAKASELADILIPKYFLSQVKIFHEYNLALNDINIARRTESDLKSFLSKYLKNDTSEITLSKMESISNGLINLRSELLTAMTEVRVHIQTIEINILNAEKILAHKLLQKVKDELNEILIERKLRLKKIQLDFDVNYLQIDLSKGSLQNEKLTHVTAIRSAVWSRRITLLFGFLSLLGVLQLFPNFQQNLSDWKKTLILIGFLILVSLLIYMKDIIGNLSGKSDIE